MKKKRPTAPIPGHDRDTPTQVRYVVKNIPMEMVVAGTDSASISLKFTSTAFSWSHVTVAPSS